MRISAFWPLTLFFAFSSLAFGCMEGWAIATCEVILFLGAATVGWNNREFWSVPRRLWLPALLVAVLMVIGLVQLVPVPTSWWKAVGSDRYTRYTEGAEAERLLHTEAYRVDPFGPEAGKPLPPETWTAQTPPVPHWIPATFTPAATGRALLALAAGLCLILLLDHLAEEEGRRLSALLWLLGCLGLSVALAHLLFREAGHSGTILGLRQSQYADIAFGSFVNSNHGVAFLNLAMPALYFLLWRFAQRYRRRRDRWGVLTLLIACALVHVTAVVSGGSMAGMATLAFFPVAWGVRAWRRGGAMARLTLSGAALFVILGSAALLWLGTVPDHGRLRMAANLPGGHWLVGHGLNSFQDRFPAVSTDLPMLDAVRYSHMEDEYLQLFFEAGAPAALLGMTLGAAVLFLAARLAADSAAGLWLAPALAGEALRASIDFSAHVFPLVGAICLLCVAGMLCLERAVEPPLAHPTGPGEESGR